MNETQILAFFATAKTPNGLTPTVTGVDIKPSGLVLVDGTVTVPDGIPGLPAGVHNVTWGPNGTLRASNPRIQNQQNVVLLSVFAQVS